MFSAVIISTFSGYFCWIISKAFTKNGIPFFNAFLLFIPKNRIIFSSIVGSINVMISLLIGLAINLFEIPKRSKGNL